MPKRLTGVARLRELVNAQVHRTSLRNVAAEIGMSSSGLHVFLRGSRPHPSTVIKLSRWAEQRRGHLDKREVDAAVSGLREYIRSAPTREAIRKRYEAIVAELRPDGVV